MEEQKTIKDYIVDYLLDGEDEKRRGKKLRHGDIITIPSQELQITIVDPTQVEIE